MEPIILRLAVPAVLLALACSSPERISNASAPDATAASGIPPAPRYAWTGTEYTRLVGLARLEIAKRGVRGWPARAKCRWLASFMMAEATSERAPDEVRRYYRGRRFEASAWESATQSLGCSSSDLPEYAARTSSDLPPQIAVMRWRDEGCQPPDCFQNARLVPTVSRSAGVISGGDLSEAIDRALDSGTGFELALLSGPRLVLADPEEVAVMTTIQAALETIATAM